jgi:hypothetical protein
MSTPTIKVLYIAGMRRSGSTILNNILDQIDGLFSVGEIQLIWHMLKRSRACACGKVYQECEAWQPILEEAYGAAGQPDVDRLAAVVERLRYQIPALRAGRLNPALADYAGAVEKLYRAIQDVTGCRVIVDSSKSPVYGYLLQHIPSLEVYVLHLVRDSRAVAYSVIRSLNERDPAKRHAGNLPTTRLGLIAEWMLANALSMRLLWPGKREQSTYLRLRYEDVIAEPEPTIRRLLEFVGVEAERLPFANQNEVRITPTHAVYGNPRVASRSGTIPLRVDNAWTASLSRADKLLTTLLTAPLLAYYGYPIMPRGENGKRQPG